MNKKNVLFQICLMTCMAGLLSFHAYAQTSPASNMQTAVGPFDPISTRILSDPLFLPLKGQVYGKTDYVFYDWRYGGSDAASGVRNYNEKDFLQTLTQEVKYGITDDFIVQVTEVYTWEHYNYKLDGFSSAGSFKDMSNPEFGATYRILDQSVYPVDVDLSVSYTPNFDINGGYVASGLNMVSFTGSIGREMKALTVRLTGSAQYYGVEKDISLNQRDGPYWLNTLGIETQTRLTDRFSVNCGFNYYFPDGEKNHLMDVVQEQAWGSMMYIDMAFNYQIIPHKLVASITYSYVPFASVKYKYSNPAVDNENINGFYGNNVGMHFEYLF